ncbi:hypothetical protein OIU79_009112 [Salix purpurea]|uniref:Uncharacterized protein n=1 Tax=Salix purpurea TaxID=77065 RepID=A0A9Q0YWZ8_SALPP|nr:hypothetical protein OIU79_009112 [Salix purpurea]
MMSPHANTVSSLNYKAFQISKRWSGFHDELDSEQVKQFEFLIKHIQIGPE